MQTWRLVGANIVACNGGNHLDVGARVGVHLGGFVDVRREILCARVIRKSLCFAEFVQHLHCLYLSLW